jgi:hypothetical protein
MELQVFDHVAPDRTGRMRERRDREAGGDLPSAAQPPSSARCSSSSVRTPFLASAVAQVSPLTPPPITIAS